MKQHTKTARFVMKDGERKVTREQILKAMEEFDHKKRGSVSDTHGGWFVLENEQRYHPKWLLKLATKAPILGAFNGSEARKTLNDLGFDLEEDEANDPDDLNEASLQASDAIKFGLERDLQAALRNNLEQLEPGLSATDGGKEQMVESGRIDITAADKKASIVVIELKIGKAGRHAIGQVLAYMGDLTENQKKVRGILIAEEFSPQAVAAARVVPNLKLITYNFKFTFKPLAG